MEWRDRLDEGETDAWLTTNGAATWNSIKPVDSGGFVFPSLRAVDIYSATEIVAVGDGGELLLFDASSGRLDFVATVYDLMDTMAPDTLLGVTYASDGGAPHIFAAGEDGAVLHYDPVADEWTQPHSSSSDVVTGISFRSPTLGWITGTCNEPFGVHSPTGFGDSTISKYE